MADPSETEVTHKNMLEQLEELKAVTKGIDDATIRDLVNVNDRTNALDTNKIWVSITGEENTIIVDKLDLSAAKDGKVGYIIGEHAREELIRLAEVNYKAECDIQIKDK